MATNPEPHISRLVTRILHLPMTCDAEAFGMTARVTERFVVELTSPGAEHRSRLEDFVLASIEADLDARGAAPPGWDSNASLQAKIDDQLYRARLLGAGGLALRFAGLECVADETGQLGEADSECLRQLLRVAEHERLQLFLPEPTAALRVVGAPEPLSDWLSAASRDGRVAAIEYEPAPCVDGALDCGIRVTGALLAEPSVEAFANAELRSEGPEPASEISAEPAAAAADDSEGLSEKPVLLPPEPSRLAAPEESFDPERAERCAAWAGQLRNMNGPKLHAAVERVFVTAYLPLSREAAAGRSTAESRFALESWAEGFAQSYAAAFKTFGSKTKRPRMVRDVIELGIAWLNQHRARQCQLLLVDGMRFDLGQRVNEQLARRLTGRALCAEQTVLWAALPSNAESQHLGLTPASRRVALERKRSQPSEGSAPRIESVRVGPRELFRLDQIAADLAKPGEPETRRLDRLASLITDVVAPWMQAQPPDTLVVVFGDHGFHWHATLDATSAGQRGGALPEQVLVPASGWLLGQTAAKPARVAAGLH